MKNELRPRNPYPTDVRDDEWAFVAPYLRLMREDAPQRAHELREVYNALRWLVHTGSTVDVAFVDLGSTGEAPAAAAATHGIRLEVVTLPEAKRGFVLLPRRWVVERSVAWAARFRRLAKDYERVPDVVAGLHFVAVVSLMLRRLVTVAAQSP